MRQKNTRADNQLGQHHRRHPILSKWIFTTKVKYFSRKLFVSVFLMQAMQIVTSWFSFPLIKICNNTALIGHVKLSIIILYLILTFHWISTWLKIGLFSVLLIHRHFKPLQEIEARVQNLLELNTEWLSASYSLPANFSSKDPFKVVLLD